MFQVTHSVPIVSLYSRGNYTCVIENVLGRTEQIVQLTVTGELSPYTEYRIIILSPLSNVNYIISFYRMSTIIPTFNVCRLSVLPLTTVDYIIAL